MLIYGRQAVIEALKEGQVRRLLLAQGLQPGTVRELTQLARRHEVPLVTLPRIELDRAVKTTRHQGIAAELPELRFAEPDAPLALARQRGEKPFLVLLDQITDPHNYGAIIRSAEALGAHGVVTEARRSAPLSPVVAKVSAGASSHLPLVQVVNLPRYMDELKRQGLWCYGAAGEASSRPEELDWNRPIALVIGSEGMGMRRLVRDKCDELVAIPMRGKIRALNASVAAGILLYAGLGAREAQRNPATARP
jgi:23S rRNA (guanosine2251-2'-O)-methyltransferase